MTENFIRHFVAIVGTLTAGLIYYAGYTAGTLRWWWAGISVLGVYLIIYHLITAGGGGHH